MPDVFHIEVERALRERTSGQRILAFDSLRGLAAVVVVFCHFRLAFTSAPPAWFIWPLFAGHQAVTVFFVLSGYVLSLPYWQGAQLPYGKYLVRRFFRIYVPYVGAVALAAAGAWRLSNATLPLTPWFSMTWHAPLTAKLLIKHLAMGGGATLNTAFWSLRYEVEMSLILPAICLCMQRLGRVFSCGLALLTAMAGAHTQAPALIYGSCFLFGTCLARERATVRDMYRRAPRYARALLLIISLAMFFSSIGVLVTAGACGVLVLCENSRARVFLERTVPEYLGRVSFSMYLVHGTVLELALISCYGKLPFWALTVSFLAGTLVASHLFCVLFEEPATRLGRNLTKWKIQSGQRPSDTRTRTESPSMAD